MVASAHSGDPVVAGVDAGGAGAKVVAVVAGAMPGGFVEAAVADAGAREAVPERLGPESLSAVAAFVVPDLAAVAFVATTGGEADEPWCSAP